MITRDTIGQIISATRIEEVISDFVTLRRRGVNLIGLCPFHNEKTPSFTVSPTKGIFKCFGCGKAGNAVNFLMEHEHFTYPESLRYLADKYQIEIEEEAPTPEMEQELSERESLFNLNQFAGDFFVTNLRDTEEGKAVGLSYLKERGIRDDIITKFQLGYNPEKWDAFSKHAIHHGYKQDILLKSGLTLQKEGRLYDRFHARIIFPIHSVSGRIIGFGGRTLTSGKHRPKYVNSPDSSIYHKSKSLYGISFARNAIASKDNCYLVEGYTDVISLYQAGIENVVASSGTSLTQEQIGIILRYTKNITILYDGDPAGIKASFRGIDMILEEGMNVRIVLFPDGEDPDSFSRKHHPKEVNEFITGNADNFILFKTQLLLEETTGDPIRKASLIKEIVTSIARIPDGITRTLYTKECSALMNVPEQVLVHEVRKVLRDRIRKKIPEIQKPEEIGWTDDLQISAPEHYDLSSDEYQERELIRLLLLFGSEHISLPVTDEAGTENELAVKVADFMVADIARDELTFENPLYASVFSEFMAGHEKGEIPDREVFISHEDPEISRMAVDLVFTPYELSANWEKNNILVDVEENRIRELVTTAILSFKAKKLDKIIAAKLKEIQGITDHGDQELLLNELKILKTSSILINKELGRIITR